jgi:hypothetical protein
MKTIINAFKAKLSALNGRCGFWITSVLVLLPLLGLIFIVGEFFWQIIWHIFSGEILTERWGRWMARGALDQTGIFKMYFLFTAFSILYFPWVSMIRFLANRKKQLVYWTFVTGSAIVVLFLLCLPTTGSNWLRLYINNMGITQKRLLGVIFALFSYSAIIAYLIWAYKPVRNRSNK